MILISYISKDWPKWIHYFLQMDYSISDPEGVRVETKKMLGEGSTKIKTYWDPPKICMRGPLLSFLVCMGSLMNLCGWLRRGGLVNNRDIGGVWLNFPFLHLPRISKFWNIGIQLLLCSKLDCSRIWDTVIRMLGHLLLSVHWLKVVHNYCKTVAFMFNGGSCSSSIFCLIDTRILLLKPLHTAENLWLSILSMSVS